MLRAAKQLNFVYEHQVVKFDGTKLVDQLRCAEMRVTMSPESVRALTLFPSIRLVCLSVCLSACLPACLSACLSVCLSVCHSFLLVLSEYKV